MSYNFYALIVCTNVIFMLAAVALKRVADTGSFWALGAAVVLLASANALYVKIISSGLSQGATLGSMIYFVMMAISGVVFFGERLTANQIAAVLLVLIAMWLFANPSNPAS